MEDRIETIDRSVNGKGQDVWRFKADKLNVTVTYLNYPSPEAIKNTNAAYNELFHKFNPLKDP